MRPFQNTSFSLTVVRLACAVLLSSLITSVAFAAKQHPVDQPVYSPFQAGDYFSYNLYWSGIKVGEAELSFHETALQPLGPKYLHMRFAVRTSGLANRIYRVDNLLETWIDTENWRPVLHRKRQREGSRERDIELAFDWETGEVHYTNRGEKREPVKITEDTQDPLSLLGKIAQNPFFVGAKFSVPATDGRAPAAMESEIVGAEEMRTPVGLFNSYKADVSTDELRGVFSKSPDAVIEVWFSADQYRIPLRMRSEVAVGSFYGELTAYRSAWLDSFEDAPSFIGETRSQRRRNRR